MGAINSKYIRDKTGTALMTQVQPIKKEESMIKKDEKNIMLLR